MNVRELLEKLQSLPPDLPVWLGVDAGEGYIPAKGARKTTGFDEPLDLDEAGMYEHEYVPMEKYIPDFNNKVDEINEGDTDVSVWRPIVIIE